MAPAQGLGAAHNPRRGATAAHRPGGDRPSGRSAPHKGFSITWRTSRATPPRCREPPSPSDVSSSRPRPCERLSSSSRSRSRCASRSQQRVDVRSEHPWPAWRNGSSRTYFRLLCSCAGAGAGGGGGEPVRASARRLALGAFLSPALLLWNDVAPFDDSPTAGRHTLCPAPGRRPRQGLLPCCCGLPAATRHQTARGASPATCRAVGRLRLQALR